MDAKVVSMKNDALTAADYERASEIITPESWQQGHEGFSANSRGVNDQGKYCYLGALKKAHWERTQEVFVWNWAEKMDPAEQARRTWQEYHGHPKYSVDCPWDWNDIDAESAEEVSVKLMEIGKFLRNKGEEISD